MDPAGSWNIECASAITTRNNSNDGNYDYEHARNAQNCRCAVAFLIADYYSLQAGKILGSGEWPINAVPKYPSMVPRSPTLSPNLEPQTVLLTSEGLFSRRAY
jgi:hypothetical protein